VKETPKRNINPVLCHPILHVDRIVEVLLKSYVAVLNIQDLDMKIIFSRLTMQSILADTRPKAWLEISDSQRFRLRAQKCSTRVRDIRVTCSKHKKSTMSFRKE
jgi:hypothetical protein